MKNFAIVAGLLLASLTTLSVDARERETGGRLAPMALEVTFASPGNGIDAKTLKQVLAVVSRGLADTSIVEVTAKAWGREGERTYCVEFAKYQDVDQYRNALTKIVAKGNQLSGVEKTGLKTVLACGEQPAILPNM